MATVAVATSIGIAMADHVFRTTIQAHDSRQPMPLLLLLPSHRVSPAHRTGSPMASRALNVMQMAELASPTTLMLPAASAMVRPSIRAQLNSIVPRPLSAQRSHRAAAIRRPHMLAKRMGMTKLLIHIRRQPMVRLAIISNTMPMDMAPLNHPIRCMRILLLRITQNKQKHKNLSKRLRANWPPIARYTQNSNTHTDIYIHITLYDTYYVVDFVFIYFILNVYFRIALRSRYLKV